MGSSQKSEPGDEIMGDIQDCWGNVEKFARIREKSMLRIFAICVVEGINLIYHL